MDRNRNTISLRHKLWIKVIDYVLLTAVLVFSLLYVVEMREFAEIAVRLPSLSYPIFIGEFILIFCGCLLLIKFGLQRVRWNHWHSIIVICFCFIMIKAAVGYVHWGPLALRDAALFYYFAFAIISYYAFRLEYFSPPLIYFIFIVLWSISAAGMCGTQWFLGTLVLGLITARNIPNWRLGLVMAALILLTAPYKNFIYAPRMMILGNFIAIIFFLCVSTIFIPKRPAVKWTAILLLILGLSVWLFGFSRTRAESILRFGSFIEIFQQRDAFVQAQKSDFAMPARVKYRLYNPQGDTSQTKQDPPVFSDQVVLVSEQQADVLSRQQTQVLHQPSPGMAEKNQDLLTWHPPKNDRISSSDYWNAVFRLFIWRDMCVDIYTYKPLVGFDFGRPFRSISLEILQWAQSEWGRDGWVAPHNSYLNMIYRAGIFGFCFIIVIWMVFVKMVIFFIKKKSIDGILLCAVLLSWLVAANFLLIFELPYSAIPLWTLYGLTLAFKRQQSLKKPHENSHRT